MKTDDPSCRIPEVVVSEEFVTTERLLRREADTLTQAIAAGDPRSVASGDVPNASNMRTEILNTIATLKQTYVALLEIYRAEGDRRKEQHMELQALDERGNKVRAQLEWIANESPEAQSLRAIDAGLAKIDCEIATVAEHLVRLKTERKSMRAMRMQVVSTVESGASRLEVVLDSLRAREVAVVDTVCGLGLIVRERGKERSLPETANIKDVLSAQARALGEAQLTLKRACSGADCVEGLVQEVFECVRATEEGLANVSQGLSEQSGPSATTLDKLVVEALHKGEEALEDIARRAASMTSALGGHPKELDPFDDSCISPTVLLRLIDAELEPIRQGIAMVTKTTPPPQQAPFSFAQAPQVATSNVHATARQL